jgi:RNA polymerase sigma-70 factor (ECF subfamily)
VDEELYRLIGEAKRGGKEAFAQLLTQYKDRVYRHAFGMLGERMEAEDITQEAFIKAYYSLARLESEYAFSSWMMQIVSNLCKDRLKKCEKERTLRSESIEEVTIQGVEDKNLGLGIQEAMTTLSPEHREVILLHDVQGYRYEEIAAIVGIPLGTVKSRLNMARLALRNEMKKGDE